MKTDLWLNGKNSNSVRKRQRYDEPLPHVRQPYRDEPYGPEPYEQHPYGDEPYGDDPYRDEPYRAGPGAERSYEGPYDEESYEEETYAEAYSERRANQERNYGDRAYERGYSARRPQAEAPRRSSLDRQFVQRQDRRRYDEYDYRQRKKAPFMVPILPLAVLAALLLGIFLIVGSRNSSSKGWFGRDVVSINPPVTGAGDYSMAVYSGVTPQGSPQGGGVLGEDARPAAVSAGSSTVFRNEAGPAVENANPAGSAESSAESEEEIPLDLTETFTWKSYTVKRGDSVSEIARAHALSMDAVIASNNISNARLLRMGEVLRIPNMDGIPYIVKKGDSLLQISRAMGVPLEAILDANNIERDEITAGETLFIPGARMRSEDLKLALGELFIHPVRGARLSSPFGWRNDPFDGVRRYHAAIDLAAPQGTPIVAAMDGEVIGRGFDRTLGNYIVLKHSGGLQTVYAHLHSFSVASGDRVRQGAQIGAVGSTGRSTGPHLHFMVYKNGQTVNPIEFLRI